MDDKINKYCNQWLQSVTSLNGWIPCSRMIPKEPGMYLVSTCSEDVEYIYWNGINFEISELVVAWMYKPKPYKFISDM